MKQPSSKENFRAPQAIFWTGFLLRVLYITLAHTYRIKPVDDHFQFGWEMGRIARALVHGYGFADPFTGHTGPTAWCPPLFPFLIAAVFKLFGVYTALSAWVILALDSLFSAATSIAVYEIALRCYRDRKLALWAAWLWALYPATMQYAVRWIWETTFTTLLFAVVLVLALRTASVGSPRRHPTRLWIAFGLLWGAIALTNTTLLLFLPVCGLWMLLQAVRNNALLPAELGRAAAAAVLFIACITPWLVRDYTAFHALIPIRGNFGAELYSSLLEGNNGFVWGPTVPLADHAPAYLEYKRLGEHLFVQQHGAIANTYVRTHKKLFVELAIKRVYFFWVSVPHPTDAHPAAEFARVLLFSFGSLSGLLGLALSLRHRIPAAGLFAWAFLLLPITYYFILAHARFRHPLEPLIVIFSVYLFRSATPRGAAARTV